MRYPIDVLFLDDHGRVIALYPSLEPRLHTLTHEEARYALEMAGGTILSTGTCPGDRIEVVPAEKSKGGHGAARRSA
jgi:uncharacterized membrane protein (UPF0127 family)